MLLASLLPAPVHGQLEEEGCYVSFFAGKAFGPPAAQLRGRSFVESFETGAVVHPDLKSVGGQKFIAEARSLVVGPDARLVGYAEGKFRHEELVIGPGRQVLDLSAIRFHERVRSLKVLCD